MNRHERRKQAKIARDYSERARQKPRGLNEKRRKKLKAARRARRLNRRG